MAVIPDNLIYFLDVFTLFPSLFLLLLFSLVFSLFTYEWVKETIEEEGPFDRVMGFSVVCKSPSLFDPAI